ncbi:hypothetical protein [Streptomyces sp. NPDC020681]|uniref:hypothetical protein n=1 Tax=Streptomyces sp. NPDC020681 TaxID=3365083 RepID=UPI0037A57CE5
MDTDQWSLAVSGAAFFSAVWVGFYARSQARSAAGQLEEAKQARREQNEPYVVVDIQAEGRGSSVLYLVIENIGPTMARNVKISVSPELTSSHGEDVGTSLNDALARTIAMLPPRRRLEYFFDSHKRFDSGMPMTFDFTVTAHGPAGPVEELRYTVDLNVLTESLIGERPSKRLEEKVQKLTDEVKGLSRCYRDANEEAITATQRHRREEVQRRLRAQEEARNAQQHGHGSPAPSPNSEP